MARSLGNTRKSFCRCVIKKVNKLSEAQALIKACFSQDAVLVIDGGGDAKECSIWSAR